MHSFAFFKSASLKTAALLLFVALAHAAARAQEHDAPKVEVGAQFSSLSITPPGFFGTENAAGFGGRVTYNITDHLAVEAEGNFYPTSLIPTFVSGGAAQQAQLGVKAGKRFNRFGVFAKARPGLISFGNTLRGFEVAEPIFPGGPVHTFTLISDERKTHFTADLGGVLELYPSRRVMVRFDFGDTIIRYGSHEEPGPFSLLPRDERPLTRAPGEVKHNFQFTGGVAYRFGGTGKGEDDAGSPASSTSERPFEAGIQFTSLALRLRAEDFGAPFFFGPIEFGTHTEAGFGGRVGYNVNDHVAFEAEGNYYPRTSPSNAATGGYPVQMQFGAKVGRRYRRFGLFGKARPGFVTFSRVLTQTGVESFTFSDGTRIFFPTIEERRRTYFTADLGGVLELYPSHRFLTRFDFGDTIIRYTGRPALFSPLRTVPPAGLPNTTRHNFQFTAGIGLRF